MSVLIDNLSPQAIAEIDAQAARIASLGPEWRPTFENVLFVVESVFSAERGAFKASQKDAISKAGERGKALGRPRKQVPDGFEPVFSDWDKGLVSATKAAKMLGVSQGTFSKWADERRRLAEGGR